MTGRAQLGALKGLQQGTKRVCGALKVLGLRCKGWAKRIWPTHAHMPHIKQIRIVTLSFARTAPKQKARRVAVVERSTSAADAEHADLWHRKLECHEDVCPGAFPGRIPRIFVNQTLLCSVDLLLHVASDTSRRRQVDAMMAEKRDVTSKFA